MEVIMNEYLSLASLASVALIIVWLSYAISVILKNPAHWGKPLAIIISLGLLLCMVVAMRDGYGFREDAVIAFNGWQSTFFSLIGVSILLIGLFALINKRLFRKPLFMTVFGLFLLKLGMMETLRFIALSGMFL